MKKDIFALLEKNGLANVNSTSLTVVNLWNAGAHNVMFLTLVPDVFASHFEEGDDVGYYRCLGNKCPACEVGIRATEHVYLPVWDPRCRQIVILKSHTGEDGPVAKLLEFLKIYREQLADLVAVIKCDGKGVLTITAHGLTPETDRGALACEAFCRSIEAGGVNLGDIVKRLSAVDMMNLPSVKRRAAVVFGEPIAPLAPTPMPDLLGDVLLPAEEKGV